MGKLDRLIDELEKAMSNEKSVLSRNEYSDVPIVFTASQMKTFTPDKIIRMRREFGTRRIYTADPRVFAAEARFMADYEDDCAEKAEFMSAFPSYAAMNDSQLRTYFTWRTKLRRGEVEKTSLSYAYVYIFELLNLVGVASPSEAYVKLSDFFDTYGKLDEAVNMYRCRWLTDFAVCYDLKEFFEKLPCDDEVTAAGGVLMSPENRSDREVLAAAEFFSSYSLVRSVACKSHPSVYERTAAAVFRELNRLYAQSGGCAELFCRRKKSGYFMFPSAVVCFEGSRRDRTVALPDGREFVCLNNHWLASSFVKDGEKSRDLGALMRYIDIILRAKLKIKNKIMFVPLPTKMCEVAEKCADEVFEELRREKLQKRMDEVKIDFANLDAIRFVADRTGERLLTEEDVDAKESELATGAKANDAEETAEHGVICGTAADSREKTGDKSDGKEAENRDDVQPPAVSPTESRSAADCVLLALLNGSSAAEKAAEAGVPLSMLCDEINEKYFDEFGDTVIGFDGDTPFLVPDYAEDLRGKFE